MFVTMFIPKKKVAHLKKYMFFFLNELLVQPPIALTSVEKYRKANRQVRNCGKTQDKSTNKNRL